MRVFDLVGGDAYGCYEVLIGPDNFELLLPEISDSAGLRILVNLLNNQHSQINELESLVETLKREVSKHVDLRDILEYQ
jgi:hypothetical protein